MPLRGRLRPARLRLPPALAYVPTTRGVSPEDRFVVSREARDDGVTSAIEAYVRYQQRSIKQDATWLAEVALPDEPMKVDDGWLEVTTRRGEVIRVWAPLPGKHLPVGEYPIAPLEMAIGASPGADLDDRFWFTKVRIWLYELSGSGRYMKKYSPFEYDPKGIHSHRNWIVFPSLFKFMYVRESVWRAVARRNFKFYIAETFKFDIDTKYWILPEAPKRASRSSFEDNISEKVATGLRDASKVMEEKNSSFYDLIKPWTAMYSERFALFTRYLSKGYKEGLAENMEAFEERMEHGVELMKKDLETAKGRTNLLGRQALVRAADALDKRRAR